MKRMSQALIILLMIDAAWVAWGLYCERVMWAWIVAYWAILTAKNAVDFAAGRTSSGRREATFPRGKGNGEGFVGREWKEAERTYDH